MIDVHDADTEAPGTWQLLRLTDDERSAVIYCPKCGRMGSLEDHEVAPDGIVSPSVECVYPGCSFHDHIKLKGWEG